jgi:hypothetical protein
MIKPWIFEFLATPAKLAQHFDPKASQAYFKAYIELWASAEARGFEGIFFQRTSFRRQLLAVAKSSDRAHRAAHDETAARRARDGRALPRALATR